MRWRWPTICASTAGPWAFEQSLLTLPVNGQRTKLLVTGGKLAIFDAIDSSNGHYEFSRDLGLQNLVASIDPRTGRKIIDPQFTPRANQTQVICPHAGGARSWPATSYDPASGPLFVPLVESCMQFTWTPRSEAETANGGSDLHWVLQPRPDSDGNFGRLEAIEVATGRIAWTRRQRAPETASVLTTASGLVNQQKSPAALLRNTSFAAAGKKRGFCPLLSAMPCRSQV
jgi:alcohol dehydrogenase (cytochrome c)